MSYSKKATKSQALVKELIEDVRELYQDKLASVINLETKALKGHQDGMKALYAQVALDKVVSPEHVIQGDIAATQMVSSIRNHVIELVDKLMRQEQEIEARYTERVKQLIINAVRGATGSNNGRKPEEEQLSESAD